MTDRIQRTLPALCALRKRLDAERGTPSEPSEGQALHVAQPLAKRGGPDRTRLLRSGQNEVMERPRLRVSGPTIDAADPIALAEFYERLLGWPIVRREGARPGNPDRDGWAILRSPDGSMKLEVQWEPHYAPPVWPAGEGEQLMMMHLDIGVADLEAGVEWATAQGATLADHQPQDDVRVMLDPEGHPFCLFVDDRLA